MPVSGDTIATITTNMGVIKIKFFADLAPEIVKNFTTLAGEGYYDGLIFHRIIEGFMIQGGDPKGNGTGGHSYKGEDTKLDDEIAPELSHIRGAVSMANSGPNTNGSQFFIVHKDSTFLDGGYSIFAQVYEGMDVVDAIASVEVDENDKPLTDVVIEKVEVGEVTEGHS
ncbi:MAG: peptidylprolyl isomerase [Candidatus Gracilibacteria bacterium]